MLLLLLKCNSLLCRWVQATTSLPPPRHSLLRAEHHPSKAAPEGGSGVRTRAQGASGAEDIIENAPRVKDSDPRDEDIVNPREGGDKEEATPRLLEATPHLMEATPHLMEASPHLMEATPGSTVQLPCKIQASNLTNFFFFFYETSQQKEKDYIIEKVLRHHLVHRKFYVGGGEGLIIAPQLVVCLDTIAAGVFWFHKNGEMLLIEIFRGFFEVGPQLLGTREN